MIYYVSALILQYKWIDARRAIRIMKELPDDLLMANLMKLRGVVLLNICKKDEKCVLVGYDSFEEASERFSAFSERRNLGLAHCGLGQALLMYRFSNAWFEDIAPRKDMTLRQ
jgi:hypothetical protein